MHAWLEVDLETIRQNYEVVRRHVGGVDIIAVVKTDGYGYGLEKMVELLDQMDVSMFAVISLAEAQRARRITQKPVLIMGYLDVKEVTDAIEEGYILSLYDREQLPFFQRTAERMGKKISVHLKLETGLNRLGLLEDEAVEVLTNLDHFPNVSVEAIYSHLACADKRDKNLAQLRVVQDLLVEIQGRAPLLPIHLVSSYALRDFKEGHFDAVRIGLAIFGIDSVLDGLRPALTCKSIVMQTKEIPAGEGVSYGHYFVTEKPTKIAVMPIGYGDGLSQTFRGAMSVLIGGQKVPVIGQICMNHIIADVTDAAVTRGEEVVIFGKQKDKNGHEQEITVTELAQQGRIRHHEIITRLGRALPKIYS